MFVVFEGIDGVGKTTQAKLLINYLKRRRSKVLPFKFPSKGVIGRLIKKAFLINDSLPLVDAFLFLADMIHESGLIKESINRKYDVVCDRYYYSFIAYQKAQGVNIDSFTPFFKELLKPDLVFILKCSVDKCMQRSSHKKRTKYDNKGFLSKVLREYDNIPGFIKDRIIILDACKSVKEVHEVVVKEVNKFL